MVRNRKPRVKFEALVVRAVSPASFNKSRGGDDEDYDVRDDDKVIGRVAR